MQTQPQQHDIQDRELAAMASISQSLSKLDMITQIRVLRWAFSRASGSEPIVDPKLGSSSTASDEYQHFADLFHAFEPTNDAEKALIASYWLQEIQGNPQFTGAQVNRLLQDLGHKVSNITRALDTCRNQKPSLIIQLRKNGKTQLASKTLKLSTEGVQKVRIRLA